MPLQLRDYQANLAKRAAKALKDTGSVVIQLETGAGKTHIAAEMCRVWARKKMTVWFIAHRQEILDQARKIFDEGGIKHGPGTRIEFKMIAAATKGSDEPPDIFVFDECHHTPAKSWACLIAASPNALRLGLTATPGRLDRKPLSDFFAEIVQGPSPKELREAGHLARYRYFAPVVPNLSGVKVRKAEYDRTQSVEIMTGAAIVGDVVEHYQRHASGQRAILFAVSVEASQDMARRFSAAGIPAVHVDARTPDDERAAATKALRDGRIKVLCNVELFTEGFDLPAIGAVILLRPTRSLALFRQMIGRGARPSGRSKTVILDHAACVVEHGLPDEEYVWTLDDAPPHRKREIEGGGRTRMRRCPECSAVHEWDDECPDCGHEYSGPREVTEIGGQLTEIAGTEIPQGFITLAEYSAKYNVSRLALWKRIRKGMPNINGFVHPYQVSAFMDSRQRLISEKAKQRMSTPEARAATSKKFHGNPSNVAKRNAALSDPRVIASRRDVIRRPELQSKIREKIRSPEARKANSERGKARFALPAARSAHSVKMKEAMTPERRAKLSATQAKRYSTPDERARMRDQALKIWADPKLRAHLTDERRTRVRKHRAPPEK